MIGKEMNTLELDKRKTDVLAAIVDVYINTGGPVASKSVALMLGNEYSSATIRNDMAYLFDLGFLEQPHTSAGRIPSHLGLRYYLNIIMKAKPLTGEEKR